MALKKIDTVEQKVGVEQKAQDNSNIFAALSYLSFIIGAVIYLTQKDNKFVRFHAMQSILFGVSYTVIIFLFYIFVLFSFLALGIFGFFVFMFIFVLVFIFLAIKIFLMYKAYKKESYKLPIIGNYAEKYSQIG
ncbi:MAG: DUF4870 domain-containing protein [Candidatus Micrarchaeota archaeon]|nr:DUF4870 domain-containing protein [Candidatus Micrarchaeota archaeon]